MDTGSPTVGVCPLKQTKILEFMLQKILFFGVRMNDFNAKQVYLIAILDDLLQIGPIKGYAYVNKLCCKKGLDTPSPYKNFWSKM